VRAGCLVAGRAGVRAWGSGFAGWRAVPFSGGAGAANQSSKLHAAAIARFIAAVLRWAAVVPAVRPFCGAGLAGVRPFASDALLSARGRAVAALPDRGVFAAGLAVRELAAGLAACARGLAAGFRAPAALAPLLLPPSVLRPLSCLPARSDADFPADLLD
jgi:hypothetical protein